MRALIAARPWLTVFQLPAYAPELNPADGVWAHLKRSIANLAPRGTEQLSVLIGSRLRHLQYRPSAARRLHRRDRPDPGTRHHREGQPFHVGSEGDGGLWAVNPAGAVAEC